MKKQKAEITTLATVETAVSAPLQVYKAVTIKEAIARLEDVRRFITKALNQSYQRELKKLKGRKPSRDEEKALNALQVDYGSIPGVNKKFLLQPGAEKLCLWLHVRPHYETAVSVVPDFPGHVEVESRVTLYAVGSQEIVFGGPLASCSSMESNFRYRWVKIGEKVATQEWRDKVGFPGKQLGTHKCYPVYKNSVKTGDWEWSERHENPNIWDERNKIRQMAEKRALVKAVRNFGALSEIFTEDPSEWKLDDDSNVGAAEEVEQPTGGRVVRAEAPAEDQAKPVEQEEAPVVEVHFPAENHDIALILHMPAAFLEQIRDIAFKNDIKKCYYVTAADAAEVQARAQAAGYRYVEVQQKETEPVKAKDTVMPPKGMVTNVRMPKGEGHMMVLYCGVWCYVYNKLLYEHLAKAVGKECQFIFAKSPVPKIEHILRIGDTMFEDGLLAIQRGAS